jgi:hypothetical protein
MAYHSDFRLSPIELVRVPDSCRDSALAARALRFIPRALGFWKPSLDHPKGARALGTDAETAGSARSETNSRPISCASGTSEEVAFAAPASRNARKKKLQVESRALYAESNASLDRLKE